MSAQLISHFGDVRTYLPWVSFIAGLGGSLHCVGMCGGLTAASCETSSDIARYQVGRLIGYLGLGLSAGLLSSFLSIQNQSPLLPVASSVLIGLLFIYWGMQSYRGKRAELRTPKFLGRLYTKLWRRTVAENKSVTKAFFTGLISIFLPCGLLYGVVLGMVALESPLEVFTAMLFFWIGTVPAMVVAPGVVRRILRPLRSRMPKAYAVSLMVIGLITIGVRVKNFDHHPTAAKATSEHHCH